MQKISGIYAIRCKANNKVYVGMSKDIYFRNHNRFRELRENRHYAQRGLQRDFLKYGENNFILEVVEICDIPCKLRVLEIKYINQFKSYNPEYGYNRLSDKLIFDETERGKGYWGSSYGLWKSKIVLVR